MAEKLRAALVGCRNISTLHYNGISGAPEIELIALCDLDAGLLEMKKAEYGVANGYTDFTRMLAEAKPDILAIATPNTAHANLTIQAAEAGVRGICCEKPMAVDPADARRMVEVCRDRGVRLIINHQRRTGADFLEAKRLADSGAIGEVYLIRGTCAGDLLSDATHLIDSIQFLAGDRVPSWLFGSFYRDAPDASQPKARGYDVSGGWRYGHPIETGAMATWEYEGGLRAEILTGGIRFPGRKYNDYEILGSAGRLWRPGDNDPSVLRIQAAGDREWRDIDLSSYPSMAMAIAGNYSRLARNVIAGGGDHPLAGATALTGFEILTGVYESGRLRRRVAIPTGQDRYPLQVMIDEGALGD